MSSEHYLSTRTIEGVHDQDTQTSGQLITEVGLVVAEDRAHIGATWAVSTARPQPDWWTN